MNEEQKYFIVELLEPPELGMQTFKLKHLHDLFFLANRSIQNTDIEPLVFKHQSDKVIFYYYFSDVGVFICSTKN